MPMSQLRRLLRESYAARPMSRDERRTLRTAIDAADLAPTEWPAVKAELFAWIRSEIGRPDAAMALDWLEAVLKLLPDARVGEPPPWVATSFSPGDGCRSAIASYLYGALRQIDICVFTISDNYLSDAILAAHRRPGMVVRLITDNDKTLDGGSDIRRLHLEGVAVRTDSGPDHMHHKFMTIDQRIVLTGSYNWTRAAAESNWENVLATNSRDALQSYQAEFDRLWPTMQPYG